MKVKLLYPTLLLVLAAVIATSGFGCKAPSAALQAKMQPITLNYWRVSDNAESFSGIFTEYQKLHPNIKINYRQIRLEDYEKTLLDALAEDKGPDILSLPQNWLRNYQAKLQPLPGQYSLAYQVPTGALNQNITYELRTLNAPTLREIKNNFADTVYKDAVIDGQTYGLPLSLETLVMIYNKDIMNRSGVTEAPTAWKPLQEAVTKMTRFDSKNNISQSGVGLGTGANVSNAFDILSLLMMQNGAAMASDSGSPTFFKNITSNFNPGLDALRFYTDFASPIKSVYAWNDTMPNSLEAFISGKVGIIFGYNSDFAAIKTRAPKLNLGIAPVPQVNSDAPANYANYWLETVSKKSQHTDEAWDVVIFATQKTQTKMFLTATNRPTALKSLINEQLQSEDLYPTAVQTLTATTWYRGRDSAAAQRIFAEMIDQFLHAADENAQLDVANKSSQKINQTL